MEYYCLINWEAFQDGKIPELTEDSPILLLAGDPDLFEWGLFECELPDDYQFSEHIEAVNIDLEILLFSSKGYPPAIAFMREDIEVFIEKTEEISKDSFIELILKLLKKHLQLQKHSPYFLSEAMVDEEDYLIKGAFYWIVGFNPETSEVEWVSEDYYIYENPASDFGLKANKLFQYFEK